MSSGTDPLPLSSVNRRSHDHAPASVGRKSGAHSAGIGGPAYSRHAGYRRNRVPGGTFFFTVNLFDRRSNLLVARIGAVRDAVRQARARAPFNINAWVVLPDHMHCLWTLPEGDADFPGRWRAI
jgi:hypothetical protein